MYSSTIDLQRVYRPEFKRFYRCIGENRQGYFCVNINEFRKKEIDILKPYVLGYRLVYDNESGTAICFAYSDLFDKLEYGAPVQPYRFFNMKNGIVKFERIIK